MTIPENNDVKADTIFALDIGTRKVMGLLADVSGETLIVRDAETIEHQTRAMAAGQVQDVTRVANVVREVAERLSHKQGGALPPVAVAVAGRNLKTVTGKARMTIQYGHRLTDRDLEWTIQLALQDALESLRQSGVPEGTHQCSGYAVVRQALDGEPTPHPVGHVGSVLELEVIATFLPRRVLDSLFAVLDEAGLEPSCVTLEPIAALQAAVPSGLRRFDLALVDIGAGTSDIAVVRNGLVRAFGMVPQAGDFITERISDLLYVDFFEAERLKRLLTGDAALETRDIFERPVSIAAAELRQKLEPAVRELAAAIAAPLVDLCGRAPQTVICVGGASQTPGLMAAIADALGIDRSRVGTRSPRGMSASVAETPQTATPFGIALIARDRSGLRFRRVHLNGTPLYLLDSGRPVDVLCALKAAGVPPERIYGKPGPARTFRVDGQLRWAKGEPGVPGRVTVNGRTAALEDELREDDRIAFEPGQAGREGRITVREAIAWTGEGNAEVSLNGRPARLDEEVPDRAALVVGALLPIDPAEVTAVADKPLAELPAGTVTQAETAETDEATAEAEGAATRSPVISPAERPIQVFVNGSPIVLEGAPRKDSPAMVFDVLAHASLLPVPGKRLKLRVNGREAGFTSPIHDGAEVHAFFD